MFSSLNKAPRFFDLWVGGYDEVKLPKVSSLLKSLEYTYKPDDIMPTGSQIFGDATSGSDYDFVLLVPEFSEKLKQKLNEDGFRLSGNSYEGDDFYIVRNTDNVNLIFTRDPKVFDLWNRCNQVAEVLALDKEDRVSLFGIIIN
jgi:hypothetical protein